MFITNAWATEEGAVQSGTDANSNGVTHSETGTPQGGDHGGAFPPFDTNSFASQLLWLAITFGLFFIIVSRVIVPRVSGILEVRRDRISRDLDEANRMKEESDAAIAAYEQELAEARNKAQSIGNTARDTAKTEAEAKRAAADSELNKKLAESESKIAAIRTKAMGEVGTIAKDTVSEIVKELVGSSVTTADVSNAIKSASK